MISLKKGVAVRHKGPAWDNKSSTAEFKNLPGGRVCFFFFFFFFCEKLFLSSRSSLSFPLFSLYPPFH